ncbi:MAG: hypothetical protein ACFFKA_17845 [Candidatus Thorarchaeota archaeon]
MKEANKMTTMYCPKCKMNVFTVREDLDIGLMIILCIFTAGIGAIIYLAIYYDKESTRCIHCKSICQTIYIENQNENSISLLKYCSKVESKQELNNQYQFIEESTRYCFNCGIELDEREGLNYCAYCGTKIK